MLYTEQRRRLAPDTFTVEQKCDFSYPTHQHRCFEILLLLDGELEFTVNDTVRRMCAGDMTVVLPHQLHSLHTPVHSRHILCIFSPEWIGSAGERLMRTRSAAPVHCTDECRALFLNIHENDSEYKIRGFLYYLCDCVNGRSAETEPVRTTDVLYRLFQYIEAHYNEECSLQTAAASMNYSYSYLSRLFATGVQIHFDEYVTRVRISHARDLLANSAESVTAVAGLCGYRSICTFNRNFKRITGQTPSEYRSGLAKVGQSDLTIG